MQVGQWVYCKDEDLEFKIHAIEGKILMLNDVIGYHKAACEPCDTEICRRCNEVVPMGQPRERYSIGVYAGKFCDQCCYGYIDHCGLDMPMGTQADVDESVEPE